MQYPFFEKFRRITSSGFYLPQVDGLRFVAIFMVVCIAHIPNFVNQKFFGTQFITPGYWSQFSLNGVFGVQFFFIISGFVLGHFFAKKYINNNGKADLKDYYLRRLTRMEPPYLLALLLFFIALTLVIRKYELGELLPHFMASFFYLHNAVYHQHSLIMPVAWTLEIEIQFYIAAPLLAMLYKIRKKETRWLVFLILIIGNTVYWYNIWHGMHLVKFLHYFLAGMLMADLYVSGIKFPGGKNFGFYTGLASCILLPFILGLYDLTGFILKFLLMVILFFISLTNEKMAKVFSFAPVAIIGGMCYSIYLIHEQVISATGRLLRHVDTGYAVLNFVIFYLVLLGVVLIASAVYFKFIEQPCMRKDWWKKFSRKQVRQISN